MRISILCVWVDGKYECKDGHALITDDDWVMLCSPNEEIISRSSSVQDKTPSLSPSKFVGEYCRDTLTDTLFRKLKIITAVFLQCVSP